MPKATLMFDLPDERYEYECANHGGDWRAIVYELATFLHTKLKYGHRYKTADEVLEAIKAELWEECNAANLDPLGE